MSVGSPLKLANQGCKWGARKWRAYRILIEQIHVGVENLYRLWMVRTIDASTDLPLLTGETNAKKLYEKYAIQPLVRCAYIGCRYPNRR